MATLRTELSAHPRRRAPQAPARDYAQAHYHPLATTEVVRRRPRQYDTFTKGNA
jgi:hypothetical protein